MASSDFSGWSEIPTAILIAELQRRQDLPEKPACGTKGRQGEYNTPLHVFALVLILVLSTLACSFPIVARRFPRLPIPHRFLFLSRHFGTGVLIATAFVHLLPTAFVSLTDPCLPSFWNTGYPAMPGLMAMLSVLAVVGIEMFFATRGAGHTHGSEYDRVPDENGHAGGVHKHAKVRRGESIKISNQGRARNNDQTNGIALGALGGSSEQQVWGMESALPSDLPKLLSQLKDENSDNDSDLDLDELDPNSDNTDLLSPHPKARHSRSYSDDPQNLDMSNTDKPLSSQTSDLQAQRKAVLQCLLLEAGILFHSVFIGLAVSVSTGPPFVVLLIAISFHQTFEGFALGSRIAAIPAFAPTSLKPWLMALAYGTTTPIGQAIGLAAHTLYDPKGQTGLLVVGTTNAISSGLLLFAGLVQLLAEDFLSDGSYESLKGRRRKEACGAVVAGSMLMALVGAWA